MYTMMGFWALLLGCGGPIAAHGLSGDGTELSYTGLGTSWPIRALQVARQPAYNPLVRPEVLLLCPGYVYNSAFGEDLWTVQEGCASRRPWAEVAHLRPTCVADGEGLTVGADYGLTASRAGRWTVTCSVPSRDGSLTTTFPVRIDTRRVPDVAVLEGVPAGPWKLREVREAMTSAPEEAGRAWLRYGHATELGALDLDVPELLEPEFVSSDPSVLEVVAPELGASFAARAPGRATLTWKNGDATLATLEVTVVP